MNGLRGMAWLLHSMATSVAFFVAGVLCGQALHCCLRLGRTRWFAWFAGDD